MRIRLVAVLGAVVLAPLLMAAECEDGGNGGGSGDKPKTAKSCDTRVTVAPKAVRVNDLVAMRTETKSTCDAAPRSHVVHITMEYRADRKDSWTLAYRPDVCRDIPRPGNPVTCQVNGFSICKVGEWRTKVLVTGTSSNGQAFSFELPEKPKKKIFECPTA